MKKAVPSDEQRYGNFIQSYSGRKLWPLDPRPEDIYLEDLAHALSLENRFNGHSIEPISVAQHSLIVSEIVLEHTNSIRCALEGLMHDASEGLGLKDIPHPVKCTPVYDHVRPYEERLQEVANIWAGLDLDAHHKAYVKRADMISLATEKRDLMAEPIGFEWDSLPEPWHKHIISMHWREAELRFKTKYIELQAALSRGEK